MTSTEPIARARILAIAQSWKGTPYHHQGSWKHYGTDCLGLIRGVWRELYGTEPETPPPYSKDWAEAAGDETLLFACRRYLVEIPKATYQTGDVLLFRHNRQYPAKHLGIVVEDHRLIHACETLPVSTFPLTGWWTRRIAAAFAFPGVEP